MGRSRAGGLGEAEGARALARATVARLVVVEPVELDPEIALLFERLLQHLGLRPLRAEPEVVREALEYQRDLWIELYRLDNP